MTQKTIVSPLTKGATDHIRSISVKALTDAYRSAHQIDITAYLPAISEIEVYRCRDTGLEFFDPGGLAGPPSFYETLYAGDDGDWAYQDEKWEFKVGARLIDGAASVLDVGCGGGAFLEQLDASKISRFGLETSALGREAAGGKGIEVYNQTIIEHAKDNNGRYDMVTAFQVLEHVDDPAAFLQACIAALKPDGTLLISVPNNDAFLQHCELLPLNLPPHHVTLWRRSTLEALVGIYPVDLVWLETEPLQPANISWYQATMEARYLPSGRFARWVYYRFGVALRRYLEENCATINGHTILAMYRKTS
ncbi:MAG: methyltransferase domain-containing protein [Alphaproteobacteria bacterium]|nr:methyltransferase domain-containing protein [Alphaproteobacteria bacterium]